MRWKNLPVLCVFAIAAGGSIAQDKQLPLLQYVDGNGNSYEFSADGGAYTLEFAPVKKPGKYNGGEPATRSVSKEKFAELVTRIDKAINKKKLPQSRDRGTSLIIKKIKDDFKEYVLPKGSADAKEIEAILFGMF